LEQLPELKTFMHIFLALTLAPLAALAADIGAAHYDGEDRLLRPENWREWVFIGAALTPNDQNFGQAYLPEFKYVYMDPVSFNHWRQTGEFREGTVIAKELVAIGSTSELSGQGYFPGEYLGMEVAVKDSDRYAGHLGGWGFYSFGQPPYVDATPVIMGSGEFDCSGCHQNADQDMIFTKFYPILNAARPPVLNEVDGDQD
jgi:Cytochrome P460